jgi:hypothetical protein
MEAIMARAFTKKTKAEQSRRHTFSSEVTHESICPKCGGLMVADSYMDLLNHIGESKFAAKRCVQCGEVIDSVILLNRQLGQEPMTVQHTGKMLSINRATKGQ